jgi:hypothetical protein
MSEDPSSGRPPSGQRAPDDLGEQAPGGPRPTASGPGRLLISVYGLFAIAATSRASVQIIQDLRAAPVAYLLSAFSAVVYVIATVALARRGPRSRRVAWTAVCVELAGVLLIGTFSELRPQDFPHATVWSGYGSGYGFVPLVLPLLGLWWLRRTGVHPS